MIEQPRRPVMDRRLEVFAYELGLHTKAEIDTLAGGKFCFVTITADLLARGLAKRFPADHVALQISREIAERPERRRGKATLSTVPPRGTPPEPARTSLS